MYFEVYFDLKVIMRSEKMTYPALQANSTIAQLNNISGEEELNIKVRKGYLKKTKCSREA